MKEFAMYSLIINIVIGVILGLIVLFLGRWKRKSKIGLTGLIVTVAGSALAGIFLSVPSFIVFSIIILFTQIGISQEGESVNEAGQADSDVD
jgi:hypothetical protein